MSNNPAYTLITGRKPNGDVYRNFKTWDVWVQKERIGVVQCVGPCWGPDTSLNKHREHHHGPWIAFVGPDGNLARNLAGTYATIPLAAEAILQGHERRKAGK